MIDFQFANKNEDKFHVTGYKKILQGQLKLEFLTASSHITFKYVYNSAMVHEVHVKFAKSLPPSKNY